VPLADNLARRDQAGRHQDQHQPRSKCPLRKARQTVAMRRLHELITGAAPDVAVKNMLYTSVVARASA